MSRIGVGSDNVLVLAPVADDIVAYLHASISPPGYSIYVQGDTLVTDGKLLFSECM